MVGLGFIGHFRHHQTGTKMPVFTEHAKGIFEGVDEITLVPAPSRGLVVVTVLRIVNTDTVSITPIIRILDSNRLRHDDEYIRVIPDLELATGEYMEYDGVVCTLAPGQSLVVELSGATTTNEPDWLTVWARESY